MYKPSVNPSPLIKNTGTSVTKPFRQPLLAKEIALHNNATKPTLTPGGHRFICKNKQIQKSQDQEPEDNTDKIIKNYYINVEHVTFN
ncbi:hypothetical protein C2G38_2179973 [Gigaspora rosea]|uniref:Uncharacterized protein n=1 Tax=Gigaspora rosea TaxID=44941 RepID=A0A397VFS3_9GLOM|nr:hypothetical protein C2G38_2179973 [Gigaspora rosea]